MGYKSDARLTTPVALATINAKTGKPYVAQVRALKGDEEDVIQAFFMGEKKQKAKVRTTGSGKDTQVETDSSVEFDSSAKIAKTLLFGIVSWDLGADPGDDADESGMLRVSEANIAELSAPDRNKLFKAINDLTDPPDEEEKKASPNGSTTSSKATKTPA